MILFFAYSAADTQFFILNKNTLHIISIKCAHNFYVTCTRRLESELCLHTHSPIEKYYSVYAIQVARKSSLA